MKALILTILLPLAAFSQSETKNNSSIVSASESKEINLSQTNNTNESKLVLLKSTVVETQYKQYAHTPIRVDTFSKVFVINNVNSKNELIAAK